MQFTPKSIHNPAFAQSWSCGLGEKNKIGLPWKCVARLQKVSKERGKKKKFKKEKGTELTFVNLITQSTQCCFPSAMLKL